MGRKVFKIVLNFLLFWVITDMFSGIEVLEGLLGYVVCGGLFGIAMMAVIPLIRFFTLPVKFISVFLIAVMLSVVVFFILNFGIPYIDFQDGSIIGLENRYFQLPEIHLSMIGNILLGGVFSGLLSALLTTLEETADSY